jgi:hypothetical protein
MPFTFDTSYFLIVVILMLVLGLPLVTSRVCLPVKIQFEEVPPQKWTPGQAVFFQEADAKLSPQGFHPFATFRMANLPGTNLNRAYGNSSDPARILLTLMAGPGGQITNNYTEIISKYQDGTILSTKNSNVSAMFDEMPGRVAQTFPAIRDLEELKRCHDSKAATLVTRGPSYRDEAKFFDEFQDYHRRFCEFQQSHGLVKFDQKAGVYRPTVWMGFRGIRNFLNPLADNFTWPRFAAVVLFATVLPVVVIWWSASIMDWLRSRTGLDPTDAYLVALGLAFTLAGGVVGYVFKHKSFVWALLLGYIPSRLLGATVHGQVFYCVWMAFVAEFLGRWRTQRERLV